MATAHIVSARGFSLEGPPCCDHETCGRTADRFFVYELDDGDLLVAFGCSTHHKPLSLGAEVGEPEAEEEDLPN